MSAWDCEIHQELLGGIALLLIADSAIMKRNRCLYNSRPFISPKGISTGFSWGHEERKHLISLSSNIDPGLEEANAQTWAFLLLPELEGKHDDMAKN